MPYAEERTEKMRDIRTGKAAGFLLAMAMVTGILTGCGAETPKGPEVETGTAGETEDVELPAAGAAAQEQPDTETTDVQAGAADDSDLAAILADPTLGGIFELYTPEEYAQVIEDVKKYADSGSESVKRMEEDLEKLKADNGKHEFVLYKSVFEETYEEDGYLVGSGFNPIGVMNPWQEYERAGVPLTAEAYRQDMENISGTLEQALEKGMLTQEQKKIILAKMEDNLKKM